MSGLLWRAFERVVASRPEVVALHQGETLTTFAQLHRAALRLAWTMSRRGVAPGDRCLIYSGNSADTAAGILATWRLGAIAALVHEEAPASHLTHAEAVCAPRLAIVDQTCVEVAAAHLRCPQLLLGEPVAQGEEPLGRRDALGSAPASIFFTSGSTGEPKGVTQSHATLLAGCGMVAAHLGLTDADTILCPVPWAFDYGYGQLLSTLLLGVPQVLPTGRNPFSICEALERHRPTVFAGLPSIFATLLRGVSPVRQTDLSSLRLLTNTGGAIPDTIFSEILAVFGHCAISLNYGLTETYRTAGLPFDLAQARPESVGFGYPGVAISVVRENGEEAEPDEVGEIVHRGVGAFLGYWGAPEATAKVLRPDPFWRHGQLEAPKVVFTGDLGWKDKDGFLMIKGRRDRQIKSMGVRVSLDEIELLMRRSGLARELVVISVPHDLLGEMIVAVIRREEGQENPTPALKAYAKRVLNQYMQPREYKFVDEFPLTPNRKIDLVRLRREFSADSAAWMKVSGAQTKVVAGEAGRT